MMVEWHWANLAIWMEFRPLRESLPRSAWIGHQSTRRLRSKSSKCAAKKRSKMNRFGFSTNILNVISAIAKYPNIQRRANLKAFDAAISDFFLIQATEWSAALRDSAELVLEPLEMTCRTIHGAIIKTGPCGGKAFILFNGWRLLYLAECRDIPIRADSPGMVEGPELRPWGRHLSRYKCWKVPRRSHLPLCVPVEIFLAGSQGKNLEGEGKKKRSIK